MFRRVTWVCVAVVVLEAVSSHRYDYCREKCPLFDPPRGAVLLPGPTKFHFYQCNFGVGVLHRCAPRTYFNPKKKVCDRPWKAHAVACHRSPNHEDEGSGDGGIFVRG